MTMPSQESLAVEEMLFSCYEAVTGDELTPLEREVLRRRIGPRAMTQHDVGLAVGRSTATVGNIERTLWSEFEAAWALLMKRAS